MNKKNKTIGIVVTICLSVFSFWFFFLRNSRECRLMKEGDAIVEKIEKYKTTHHELPKTLEDVGVKVIDESNPPLYYESVDSLHYIVWFGTSLGESKTYYSDSKKWEDYNRNMK